MFRSAVLSLLLLGLAAMPGAARGQVQDACTADATSPYAVVQIDTYPRVNLDLARTNAEREIGLMNRDYLPPDSGMLFVYQSESHESYWMYHTLIPLSIAWLAQDGTIVTIKDMPRLNNPDDQQEAARNVYGPDGGAGYFYALEVNEGWFVDHGVGVGQQIALCLGNA